MTKGINSYREERRERCGVIVKGRALQGGESKELNLQSEWRNRLKERRAKWSGLREHAWYKGMYGGAEGRDVLREQKNH